MGKKKTEDTKNNIYGLWESYFPYVVSLAVIGVACYFKFSFIALANAKEILSSVINITAIIVGFLATMISILLATNANRVMKKFQHFNAIDRLTSYIKHAVASGFFLTIYSTLFYSWLDKYDSIYWYLFLLWLYGATYFAASSYRIISLMMEIFRLVAATSNNIAPANGEMGNAPTLDPQKFFQPEPPTEDK